MLSNHGEQMAKWVPLKISFWDLSLFLDLTICYLIEPRRQASRAKCQYKAPWARLHCVCDSYINAIFTFCVIVTIWGDNLYCLTWWLSFLVSLLKYRTRKPKASCLFVLASSRKGKDLTAWQKSYPVLFLGLWWWGHNDRERSHHRWKILLCFPDESKVHTGRLKTLWDVL